MGIQDFLGKPQGEGSKAERFAKAAKGKTKEQLRDLEATLLKPEKLPKYTGPAPTPEAKDPLLARSVKIVFSCERRVLQFCKYFAVSKYVEPSLAHPDPIEALLDALEKGTIHYDKKANRFGPGPGSQ